MFDIANVRPLLPARNRPCRTQAQLGWRLLTARNRLWARGDYRRNGIDTQCAWCNQEQIRWLGRIVT